MQTYPINLIGLDRRPAVVVGGGAVAARKVQGLLEAGARVTIISPAIEAELVPLVESGDVLWTPRTYREGDLAGAFLAIAATNDPQVNSAVSEEAGRIGCLVNVVDDPELSNFILPAVVRRGELTIAISTGGGSPALARRLRERLATEIGPEYGELVALLAELRPELRARYSDAAARAAAVLALLDSDLLDVIRADGLAAGREYALRLIGSGTGETMRRVVRDGYNQCAEAYSQNRDLFKSRKYLEELNEHLSPASHILDVGCGSGLPVAGYFVEKGHILTGIDISERQIELAKENVPQATFLVKDMTEIDFSAGSFDAVVSFYAIFHIPREEHLHLFGKVFELLKRGGLFLATLGYEDWEGAEEFHGVTMHWSCYGKDKNLELVRQAGFEIVKTQVDDSGGERHLVVLAKKP